MADRVIDLRQPQDGVRYTVRDHVARITIDRPDRGNSLTPRMHRVLRAIWTEVREDPEIRVALIGAAGERHFSTGFDVSQAEAEDRGDVFDDRPFQDAVHWSPFQNQVWKPVICVVNGLCVGGGLHFVVDADIVIASRNAAFMDTHVNVGMVGAIENVGLTKRLPLGAALRMTLLGRHFRMSAERAYQLGLVDELADDPAAAWQLGEEMAAQMLGNSPQAMALSKQAVWGATERGYTESLEHAWTLLRGHWSHPDFEEGPRAFTEKRDPVWNPDPHARIEAAPREPSGDS